MLSSVTYTPDPHTGIIHLPLLDELAKKFESLQSSVDLHLEKTLLVCVQHLLPTTISLFFYLNRLGLDFGDIYVLGKIYSTVPEVRDHIKLLGVHVLDTTYDQYEDFAQGFTVDVRRLWAWVEMDLAKKDNIERVIVLDDGGRCIRATPAFLHNKLGIECKVAVVEQTTAGARVLQHMTKDGSLRFPAVLTALAEAKKQLESRFIAEVSADHLEQLLPIIKSPNLRFGIIGNGSIGDAMRRKLLSMGLGHKVIVHDLDSIYKSKIESDVMCREHIIMQSDIVFGCTGYDITTDLEDIVSVIRHNVYLVSASSEQIEFASLIKKIKKANASYQAISIANQPMINTNYPFFGDIAFITPMGYKITIVGGGCPISFDRTPKCDHPFAFQLTRALLFGSVLEGALLLNYKAPMGLYKLNKSLQRFIASLWLRDIAAHDLRYKKIYCVEALDTVFGAENFTSLETGVDFSPVLNLMNYMFIIPPFPCFEYSVKKTNLEGSYYCDTPRFSEDLYVERAGFDKCMQSLGIPLSPPVGVAPMVGLASKAAVGAVSGSAGSLIGGIIGGVLGDFYAATFNKVMSYSWSCKDYFGLIGSSAPVVRTKVNVVYFVGNTGAGKSYLVNHLLGCVHKDCFKVWFNAELPAQLEADYLKFGEDVGIINYTMPKAQKISTVINWLEEKKGVYVFDHVIDPMAIANYFPRKMCSIILTTTYRDTSWYKLIAGNVTQIVVDVMSEQEAIRLIELRIGRIVNLQERVVLAQIAKELGYLPLALAHVGAYINETKISITDLFPGIDGKKVSIIDDNAVYHTHRCNLWSTHTAVEKEHIPLLSSWDLGIRIIERLNCLAKDLLMLSISLPDDSINHDLFLQYFRMCGCQAEQAKFLLENAEHCLVNHSLFFKKKGCNNFSPHDFLKDIIGRLLFLTDEQYIKWSIMARELYIDLVNIKYGLITNRSVNNLDCDEFDSGIDLQVISLASKNTYTFDEFDAGRAPVFDKRIAGNYRFRIFHESLYHQFLADSTSTENILSV